MFGFISSLIKHAKFLFHTMMFLGFKQHHIIDPSIPKLTSSIICFSPNNLSIYETTDYNFVIQTQSDIDDQIVLDEEEFVDSEKSNGLYLGYVTNSLMDVAIQPSTFFKYPFTNVKLYLDTYNHSLLDKNVEIMKLVKTDVDGFTEYTVLVKTIWLRLIQRHWKKRMAQKSIIGNNTLLSGLMTIYK